MLSRVNIKPMSINRAFQGRRFKTLEYKAYEKHVLLLLKKHKLPDGELEIYLNFGMSSKLADIDNPVKLFVDILQKKLLFNDRRISKMVVVKTVVKKGKEFIEYEIKPYVKN